MTKVHPMTDTPQMGIKLKVSTQSKIDIYLSLSLSIRMDDKIMDHLMETSILSWSVNFIGYFSLYQLEWMTK